jgi:DNA sulfur modification protein DndC
LHQFSSGGDELPVTPSDDNLLRSEDWSILQEVCGDDQEFFQLQASLLDIEREFRGMSRRAGIYEALDDRLRTGQYADEDEALAVRQDEERRRAEAEGELEEGTDGPAYLQKALFELDTVELGRGELGPTEESTDSPARPSAATKTR